MSEVVEYYIEAHGLENDEEIKEFIELAKKFQNANVYSHYDRDIDGEIVIVEVERGWRGGGQTCKEIVEEHFGEFLKKHKHVWLNGEFTYLEHCPSEDFLLQYKEEENEE